MIRFLVFLLCTGVVMIATGNPAQAADGKIQACGVPEASDIPTDPGLNFCDIYTRQLAFAEERRKLSAQLRERQKNFSEPSIQAYKNYRANVAALNTEAEKKAAAEAKATATPELTPAEASSDQVFGPPNPVLAHEAAQAELDLPPEADNNSPPSPY